MLRKLRIKKVSAWRVTANRLLFLLHKYQAHDFAFLLKLFNSLQEMKFGDEMDNDVVSAEALF